MDRKRFEQTSLLDYFEKEEKRGITTESDKKSEGRKKRSGRKRKSSKKKDDDVWWWIWKGDYWICPVCGKKFKLVHVEPSKRHRLIQFEGWEEWLPDVEEEEEKEKEGESSEECN